MGEPYDGGVQPELKFERFMGTFDFTQVKHNLSSSDSEPLTLAELLDMADEDDKGMWNSLGLGYTESAGHPLLKKKVSKLHEVGEEDVLVVCPQEGIYIAMNTLVRYSKRKYRSAKKIHAVSTFPGYQALSENLRFSGVHVSHWQAKFSVQDGWHFCVDELTSLIQEETRILVVNFPHNPTGATLSTQQWEELYQICRSKDIFLFSDEMYRFSENDGSPPPPSACTLYDNAITLFGMSKTLALPGLRIGWLCTKNKEVMSCLQKYKDFTSMCPPAPSEILSIIALRNMDKIVERTMDIIKGNIQLWTQFFNRHSDIFDWKPPKAGPISFVRLKGWALEFGDAAAFSNKAVVENGVFVVPGEMFGGQINCLRVGFPRRGLESALEEFDKFIEANRPKYSYEHNGINSEPFLKEI